MRLLPTLTIGLSVLAFATTGTQAGDAKTIRIEPRAFYGATVSLESGVRVFRPLPSASHVIINPNRTPVHITVKDVTKRVRATSHHHYYGRARASYSRAGVGYLPAVKRHRRKVRRGGGPRGGGRL